MTYAEAYDQDMQDFMRETGRSMFELGEYFETYHLRKCRERLMASVESGEWQRNLDNIAAAMPVAGKVVKLIDDYNEDGSLSLADWFAKNMEARNA